MAYIVEPLIGTLKDKISEGLANGSLTRWGGVIRVAKGYQGGGNIVAHLRDVGFNAMKSNPLGPVLDGVQIFQLNKISSQLSSVMQLSQVAAAASVLNLGVSVVGFMVMNHKLNKLQESIGRVEGLLKEMRADTNHRFDEIDRQLVELRYIATINLDLAAEAVSQLQEIRTQLLSDKFAVVTAAISRISRPDKPDERLLEQSIHDFNQVRLSLQAPLGSRALGDGSERLWADELTRYRLWAATSSVQIATLRRADDSKEAARLAKEVALKSRTFALGWQQALMPDSELGGVYRLGHSQFVESTSPHLVSGETRYRVARLSHSEVTAVEVHARSVNAATLVAKAAPSFPENWFKKQQNGSAILDFIEESTERLESTAWELDFCERRRLKVADWEELKLPETNEGIAVISLNYPTLCAN